jgi:7-carboxy-7-deazaguanine synthase
VSALRITEIFHSIQGESRPVGYPTAFVRLTGCPLRCGYCDTAYAFHGGQRVSLADVLARVATFQVRHVCVTGGEPLAQPACHDLLVALCDTGYQVSLETSGALDIAGVDRRVAVVLDLKTPASGECDRNLWANLPHLKPEDQIKFVICSRPDYEWARDQLHQHDLAARCEVLFSPAWDLQPARDLADWILADRLQVRLQVQLHKYLWGDGPGH